MQEVARLDRCVLCDHIMKGIDCCMIRCLLLKQMKAKIFPLCNRGYALKQTYLIMYNLSILNKDMIAILCSKSKTKKRCTSAQMHINRFFFFFYCQTQFFSMMESIVCVIWTAQGTDKHLDPANLIEFQHCAVIKVNSVSPTHLSIPHREVRCSGFVVRLSHAVPYTNWWTHWSWRFCNWNSVKQHLSKYSRISLVCSDLAVFPNNLSLQAHICWWRPKPRVWKDRFCQQKQ